MKQFLISKLPLVPIVLGMAGLWHFTLAGLGNSMKAYALQDPVAAEQSAYGFWASLGLLLVGAILQAVDRRKRKTQRKN